MDRWVEEEEESWNHTCRHSNMSFVMIERKESGVKDSGTFLEVGDAPLGHDGDPGGHVGSLPLHTSFIETLRGLL